MGIKLYKRVTMSTLSGMFKNTNEISNEVLYAVFLPGASKLPELADFFESFSYNFWQF